MSHVRCGGFSEMNHDVDLRDPAISVSLLFTIDEGSR